MTRNSILMALLTAFVLILCGCERYDFSEAEEKDEITVISTPTKTGLGTVESPLTVTDFLDEKTTIPDTCWIIGYAIGSTYRTMSNATLTSQGNYQTNILLAASRDCDDVTCCVPVELKSSAMQQQFALASAPEHWGNCVMLRGTQGLYFGQDGLRNASAGLWLGDLDISTLIPEIMKWEENEVSY